MKPDDDSLPLLWRLHRRVFVDPEVRAVLDAGFTQLAAELEARVEPPHATCTVPVELFKHPQVRLCRLFLLRRGARMAVPERHTNSVQRLVSYRGRGRIHQGIPGGPAVSLRPRAIRSPGEGAAERRADLTGDELDRPARAGGGGWAGATGETHLGRFWDIVPAGVWHYPEADGGEDWATVTFHSAAEDEIVDETATRGDRDRA